MKDDDIIDIGLRPMGRIAWQRVVEHADAGHAMALNGQFSRSTGET
jgi:hypothetical protein